MNTVEKVDFDVAIIGGSVAGATAAYLLGKAGLSVVIIDPQSFPRRKCCGEGLSHLGVQYLQDLGLWTPELQSAACPFYGYDIYFEDGSHLDLTSKAEFQGVGISRVQLDSSINRAACQENGTIQLKAKVTNISRSSDQKWTLSFSGKEAITAQQVIIASGAAAEKLFPSLRRSRAQQARYGLAFWAEGTWRKERRERVLLHHIPAGQLLITALGETNINVSVLLNKDSSSSFSKTEILEKASSIILERGFIAEHISETRGAPSIQSERIDDAHIPTYFIGDAIERFDPIGGMGMTHAILSAAQAAFTILTSSGSERSKINHYLKIRERNAAVLRSLTSLSFQLNVSQSKVLRLALTVTPSLATIVPNLLKSTLPGTFDYQRYVSTLKTNRDIQHAELSL